MLRKIKGDIADRPIAQIDVVDAIAYFGVDELLDTIGIERIEKYLANIQNDKDQRACSG